MKRNLAFLLALILCLGLFVSCSQDKPNNNDDSASSSNLRDDSNKELLFDEDLLEDVFGEDIDNIIDNAVTDDDFLQEDYTSEDLLEEEFAAEDILIEENRFKELFPNYSCEIHTKYADSETNVIKYKVHPDAVWFYTDMNDDTIFIHDIKNSKLYMLYGSDKSGIVMDASNMDSTFTHPADYFMAWASMTYDTLEKGSSDVVDGRSATIFFYKLGESEIRYYIDDEMGFCLAYEIIYEGKLDTRWEMKNFQAGNVTTEDIAVPSDYTLTEIPME